MLGARSILLFFIFCLAGCATIDLSGVLRNEIIENQSGPDELRIFVLDVGQGDATLVLGPEHEGERITLLIDAGPLDPDGGLTILQLLQEQDVKDLDYLILTHYDADHLGGLVTVYESTSLLWDTNCKPNIYFPTKAIIDLGMTNKSTYSVQEYKRCRDENLSELTKGHIPVGENPGENIGYAIDLQGNYSATVVAGNGYVLNSRSQVSGVDTDNEKSIAVLISGPDDFEFLVTGDLTGRPYGVEDALVEIALGEALKSENIDVSILRAGHHGSANASTPEFIEAIRPEVSLISVGDNSHGHPHCEALESLSSTSETLIQTGPGHFDDSCSHNDNVMVAWGTILVRVYGEWYRISSVGKDGSVVGDPVFELECSPAGGCL